MKPQLYLDSTSTISILVSSADNLCKQFVPDQAKQTDLDLNCLKILNKQTTKMHAKLPSRQRVDLILMSKTNHFDKVCKICLFDLILYIPSTIFQL